MSLAAKLALGALTLLAGVLLASELASILAIVTNTPSLYADADRVAGAFCHQLPSRSPWFAGAPTVLCFRCVGLYSGVLAGPWLVWPRVRHLRHRVAIMGLIAFGPTLVEYVLDHLVDPGLSASLRWATGLTLGLGSVALLSLLVEKMVHMEVIGRAQA